MCWNTGNSYTQNWKKNANEQEEATQFMLMECPYVVLSTIEYYVNKVYFAFVEQNENKILFYSHVNSENVKQRAKNREQGAKTN